MWLLTEVSDRLSFDGYKKHTTAAYMAQRRSWAAILSRKSLIGLHDPHPASALASVGDILFCSSILPWRSCSSRPPWVGERHAVKTSATISELLKSLPTARLIWGGDWNHALSGREFTGSQEGRKHVLSAVAKLGLQVPTDTLPHRLPNLLTIDHIAVAQESAVVEKFRIEASAEGKRLSDHDAYVVEIR